MSSKPNFIGKYQLIASLGQGGMAKVYLALMAGPAGFNKLLVIKALREEMLSTSDDFVPMFLDEARLAARLNHPNVVQTYEVGEEGGRYFIAMEYLEGQSLRTVQRRLRDQGWPKEEELRVLSETARGLHYAHELRGFDGRALNVVHRDISPQNVFLTYDGQVKLLDFGIAKTLDAEHRTKVGIIKGKIDYIAPEQIRGEALDRRADVFALGAMMWEALSGQHFGGGPKVADVAKIHNRVSGREPKLAQVAPKTPRVLIKICERALALDANKRYPSAEAFANDLDAYLATTKYSPSNKTLARWVSPAFETERTKLHGLVDQQIRIAHIKGSSVPSDSRVPAAVRPARGDSGVRERRNSSLLPDLSDLTNGGTPNSEYVVTQGSVPPSVAVVLVMLAVGGATYLATQQQPPLPTMGPIVTASPDAPPPITVPDVTAPQLETVLVHLDVKPEDAIATLDDARLPGLPFEAHLAKDDQLHTLKITAHGHHSLTRVLTFEEDQHLSLVLSPRGEPKVTNSGSARTAGRPAPSSESRPAAPKENAAEAKLTTTSTKGKPVAAKPDTASKPTAEKPEKPKPEKASGELPEMRIDVEDPYQ